MLTFTRSNCGLFYSHIWFVPLPTSSAAYGVSAGVRQCQLPPSASQWGPASRHLSGQLSLLSTLHCTTLRQASTQDRELRTHACINTHQDVIGHVRIVLLCEVKLFSQIEKTDLINYFRALGYPNCRHDPTKDCSQMKYTY